MAADISALRPVMRSHGDGRKGLFITEFGWGSQTRAAGGDRFERGPAVQARYVKSAWEILLANRRRWNLRAAYWFTWRDIPAASTPCDFCDSAGLLGLDGEPKAALRRFAQVARRRCRLSRAARSGSPRARGSRERGRRVAILAVDVVVAQFPRGLIVLAGLGVAIVAAWYGLTRTGRREAPRIRSRDRGCGGGPRPPDRRRRSPRAGPCDRRGPGAMLLATRTAFTAHVPLRRAPDPGHPVLFYNPKSGGGKAERFNLADEARARGIEPIELTPEPTSSSSCAPRWPTGQTRWRWPAATARRPSSRWSPPSGSAVCLHPGGTRNHFALDLGVDRDDVVGALDAFVGGRERRVDLAEVNGRVFVNNVSLGLYAEAVQREGYREAKLRTILDTLPEMLGPEGEGLDLRWTGPGRARSIPPAPAILVSNNRYRLGRAVGSGTRPRIDDKLLGITVASLPDRRPPADPAPLARVVHARVRGRRGRPDRRGHRRRGA